jgi:hypothetical protein
MRRNSRATKKRRRTQDKNEYRMCKKKKNETSKDRDRKKEKIFTLITKRIKRAHTVMSSQEE